MERREVIRELCEKLDSDDRNIEFANKEVNQAQIQKAQIITIMATSQPGKKPSGISPKPPNKGTCRNDSKCITRARAPQGDANEKKKP